MPKPKVCAPTGKLRWPDGKTAVEVLHAAKNSRTRAEAAGFASRRREIRHYPCPACAGFHTTSWAVAGSLSAS